MHAQEGTGAAVGRVLLSGRSAFSALKRADIPSFLVAAIIGAPLVAALGMGLATGAGETWSHILSTKLTTYTVTTLGVMALVAALILAIAVPLAWLMTMYQFPGRNVFEWLLILPLAAPGYVLAFAYADLMGVAGPIQSALRSATGLGARDYWFPDVFSAPGLAAMLALSLYPYVYLTARQAFVTTSICTLDAARTLGASQLRSFRSVALPAARPAIVAGLALALMEAAADYGAADYLGVQTLTVGIFRAWASHGDAGAAARLAVILFGVAILLQWLERQHRGEAGSQATSRRWQAIVRTPLEGLGGLAAAALCTFVLLLGFVIPITRLVWLALETGDTGANLSEPLINSIILAALGATLAFMAGLAVALIIRQDRIGARLTRAAASGGYAVPGAVLALGGVLVLTQASIGVSGFAAICLLLWVYVSRFTAAGAQPMSAALERAPASMGQAARSLGAGPFRRLIRVDLPVALSGALVAALFLFVEILKELPATLMLRPFNWDTLAVKAYAYASDERLAAAALPCLVITVAGLGPVIYLSYRLSRARPGEPM
ncbi:MAG: iron ABC transporter permease [Pseudomonadota bacterium]